MQQSKWSSQVVPVIVAPLRRASLFLQTWGRPGPHADPTSGASLTALLGIQMPHPGPPLCRDPNAIPWPPTLHKHVQSRCTRLNTKESHIIKNSSLDLPLISTQPTLLRSPWSQDQLCSHTAWYKTKMHASPRPHSNIKNFKMATAEQ